MIITEINLKQALRSYSQSYEEYYPSLIPNQSFSCALLTNDSCLSTLASTNQHAQFNQPHQLYLLSSQDSLTSSKVVQHRILPLSKNLLFIKT